MKKTFTVTSIISALSVIGFLIAFGFELDHLMPFLGITIIFTNVIGILVISLIDWDGLENLHELTDSAIKSNKTNELFIQALKKMLLRDKYPIDKIKEEMEKLRKK